MDVTRVIDLTLAFAAVTAAVAIVLLLPLLLSQRRDIVRLRAWMEREPAHPAADLRASEARLDRAESDLERLMAERGEAALDTTIQTEPGTTPVSPAAARVTSERPALERITLERAALEPHPRWRRFSSRVTQPRMLAAIAALAVLAGAAAIYGAVTLPLGGDGDGPERTVDFDPSSVTVSVLNGTPHVGLAGKVESDVEANGYDVGTVRAIESGFERTVVMFRPGERRAAGRVASDLGVRRADVARLDREIDDLAGDAGVVVIVGEDRAP